MSKSRANELFWMGAFIVAVLTVVFFLLLMPLWVPGAESVALNRPTVEAPGCVLEVYGEDGGTMQHIFLLHYGPNAEYACQLATDNFEASGYQGVYIRRVSTFPHTPVICEAEFEGVRVEVVDMKRAAGEAFCGGLKKSEGSSL